MNWLCWISAIAGAVVMLGWIGYPIALLLVARARGPGNKAAPKAGAPQGVSVVIATRESPRIVRDRLLNLRQCEVGGVALELVVGVDCRAEHDLAAYEEACRDLATVVPGDPPGGKACSLNAAVRATRYPVLVFTDSLQRFDRYAIRELLARFEEESVGSVTGTYEFGKSSTAPGLLRRFWAYELLLRRLESEIDSVVAVTGAIYALRRELWVALPAGLICDDLFVPMQVVRQGRRVVASPTSLASDDRRFTRAEEFSRKVRTLTGMLQFCVLCPWALVPVRNRIWSQFVCHKLLRLATPYLAILCLVGVIGCLRGPAWLWPALAMVSLLGAAVLFLAPRDSLLHKVREQAVWAGYLLAAPVVAAGHALRGNWDIWAVRRERNVR